MSKVLKVIGVLLAIVGLGLLVVSFLPIKDNPVTLGYRENTLETTVTSSVGAVTGWGTAVSVVYYRNLGISIGATGATSTVKLACSLSDTEPTWSSAQSATNMWDYVQMIDTENGTSIDGDTGVSWVNSTDVRLFEANSNNFRWCNVNISGTTGNTGTTTVKFKPADNS